MTIRRWALFPLLLISIAAAPAAGQPAEEATVLSAEQQFGAAVAANDTKGISDITNGDWRIIDADGRIISRADFLKVIASGTLKHSALTSSETSARTYGDTAVVTARSQSKGTYAGAAFSTDEISTDVWVRRDGRWLCVLTQLTALKQ